MSGMLQGRTPLVHRRGKGVILSPQVKHLGHRERLRG
jgi:hypothetical protein